MGIAAALPSPATAAGQAAPKSAGRPYVPQRTPWGDPDLQGNFTNKSEQSTPFERPAEFEGRRHEDLTRRELADILQKRQQQVLSRAPGIGPLQFRDYLDVTKGSRAWLVVDPADGKIPPLEFACHEGNYAVPNILSGARAGERDKRDAARTR